MNLEQFKTGIAARGRSGFYQRSDGAIRHLVIGRPSVPSGWPGEAEAKRIECCPIEVLGRGMNHVKAARVLGLSDELRDRITATADYSYRDDEFYDPELRRWMEEVLVR